MRAYLIRRLLLIFPTFILVTIIVFLCVRFVPGDVIDLMMAEMSGSGMSVSEVSIATLKEALGLNVPMHIQYFRWLGVLPQESGQFLGIFQADLGESLWRQEPVLDQILQRLPVSIELGSIAVITSLMIAIPVGVYSAIRQDTWGDYSGRTFSILCVSVPSFWIGTMVMVYPAILWGWAPALRYIPITQDLGGNLLQFLIPGIIMGLVMSGTTMRMTRTMMLEVLRQDYIRTAWSKGLRERTVIFRHTLKNALIPVVTIVGMMLTILIGGTVIIEQIFVLPGVGLLMFNALTQRDYPVISGLNVVLTTTVLFMNVLVDLTYAWLDPRVHYK
ncbi:ABC transporter permease [Chloroflexota bacterium]